MLDLVTASWVTHKTKCSNNKISEGGNWDKFHSSDYNFKKTQTQNMIILFITRLVCLKDWTSFLVMTAEHMRSNYREKPKCSRDVVGIWSQVVVHRTSNFDLGQRSRVLHSYTIMNKKRGHALDNDGWQKEARATSNVDSDMTRSKCSKSQVLITGSSIIGES